MILDGNSYFVSYCLIHGVAVDFITECLVRFRNGRSCKAHEGGIRQCFSKNFGVWFGYHRLHVLICVFTELDAAGGLNLGSVSFVAETDDIGTVVNQANWIIFPVTELLNGTDIESSALTET